MNTTAVVLAGGSGRRLRAGTNKVYLQVGGRALVEWSLDAMQASPLVDDVVLVVRPADRDAASALVAAGRTKVRAVVDGGPTRHDSEQAALDVVADRIASGAVDLVLVHDAARPFVDPALLARLVAAARTYGGAIPGLGVHVPVFRRRPDGWAQRVPTGDLRRVQTPQVFRARPLLESYTAAHAEGFRGVDTAHSVARYTKLQIAVVEGDEGNVKITYADDLRAAAAHAATRGRTGPER